MFNKRKTLFLFLIMCFLITLFPFQAFAYVDTDNIGTPATKNEKGNWVGELFNEGFIPKEQKFLDFKFPYEQHEFQILIGSLETRRDEEILASHCRVSNPYR